MSAGSAPQLTGCAAPRRRTLTGSPATSLPQQTAPRRGVDSVDANVDNHVDKYLDATGKEVVNRLPHLKLRHRPMDHTMIVGSGNRDDPGGQRKRETMNLEQPAKKRGMRGPTVGIGPRPRLEVGAQHPEGEINLGHGAGNGPCQFGGGEPSRTRRHRPGRPHEGDLDGAHESTTTARERISRSGPRGTSRHPAPRSTRNRRP